MTDTIELKPCPFCGERIDPPRSRQSSSERSEGFVAFAVCYSGGYATTAHRMGLGDTEIEAIRDAAAKWSRRAHPASVPDEVRSLRNLCAELYQVLGVLDAPANVLDAASAAANGEPVPAGSLLPFSCEQHEALVRGAERAEYWKQRAKSAEGHLWCADHLDAAKALHPRTALSAIAWDDLSPAQIAQLSSAVTVVIGAVNACRDARRPTDTAMSAHPANTNHPNN